MKKSLILSSAFAVLAISVFGAVKIKYVNKDAKLYNMQCKIGSNVTTVTFNASAMSTVTVAGAETELKISTQCGVVTVKDGASVTVKNGCLTVIQPR